MTDESDDGRPGAHRQRIQIEAATVQRIDTLVIQHLPILSRRRVRTLFERHAIEINHRRARKGDRAHPGDIITVDLSSLARTLTPQPELSVRVLYVDDAVVAVDKPAGMPSVARDAEDEGTVANFLIGRFPEIIDASANPFEAGLVHRLDTDTSGVLLAARSRDIHKRIRSGFARDAVKDYVAIVRGQMPRTGHISTPMAHDPKRARRMRVIDSTGTTRATGGRPAETAFRTVASDAEMACLAVRIRTGVRHQIRAHLASIQHAVVGDRRYGSGLRPDEESAGRRLLLHAYRLRLEHPQGGASLDLLAELPPEFAEILSARSWRLPQGSDWDRL